MLYRISTIIFFLLVFVNRCNLIGVPGPMIGVCALFVAIGIIFGI